MSKAIKNGKQPLSQRPSPGRISAEDAFGGGTFDIPADIRADMDAKGLEPRWLNAAKVYKNQGYHEKGWIVYRNAELTGGIAFGKDPDGVVRRGDCILGYKPKEQHQKHKAFLTQQREAQLGFSDRQKADMAATAKELKSVVRDFDPSDDE